MKKIIVYLSILLFWQAGFTQEADTIQKLKGAIERSENDSVMVRNIGKLCNFYREVASYDSAEKYNAIAMEMSRNTNDFAGISYMLNIKASIATELHLLDSAKQLVNESIDLATKHSLYKELGMAYNISGKIADYGGDHQSAKEYFELAKKAFIVVKDSLSIAGMDQNIGVTLTTMGKLDDAIKAYFETLRIYEKKGSKSNIVILLNNIAFLFNELGDIETAIGYLERAILISKSIEDKNNLSMSYINLSISYSKLKDNIKTLEYLKKAEDNLPHPNPPIGRVVRIYYNRGFAYVEIGRYDDAIKEFNKCLELSSKANMVIGIAYSYLGLGLAYNKKEDPQTALANLKKVQQMTENMEVFEIEIILQEALYSVYKKMGDYKLALESAEVFFSLSDSVYNAKRSESIERMKTVYDTERKEQENIQLRIDQEHKRALLEAQSNTIRKQYIAVGIISLILVVLVITVVQFFRQKNKLKYAMTQLSIQNTEIKQQGEVLKELNATKDRFFSIIAHDLKSPFTSLIGYTSLLDDDENVFNAEQRKFIIHDLKRSAQSTYELLENLLAWSMSQGGSLQVQKETIQVNELIDTVCNLVNHRAKKKSISITVRCHDQIEVETDRKMLSSVLRNLLSNSIKFSMENTAVEISAEKQDNQLLVTIKDEGIGMSPLDIDNLFRIDVAVSRPGTSSEKGTGLGLIMCHEFIQMMGGELSVQSELGKGTTISFSIPTEA